MALYHNRYVRWYVSLFLKLALTRPGKWLLSNFNARLDPIIYRWTAGRLEEKAAVWERLVVEVPNFDAYEEVSGRNLRVFRLAIPGIEETCVR